MLPVLGRVPLAVVVGVADVEVGATVVDVEVAAGVSSICTAREASLAGASVAPNRAATVNV